MTDGTWLIHLKKQQMNVYVPFWLVIECNNCGSEYRIDADKGVMQKYVNNYFQEKNAKGNQEQDSTSQLCATATE